MMNAPTRSALWRRAGPWAARHRDVAAAGCAAARQRARLAAQYPAATDLSAKAAATPADRAPTTTAPNHRRPRRPHLTRLTTLAALASAGVLLVLGGCASPGTVPTPLAQRSPASLGLAADASTAFPTGDWWQALGDPALDDLITRALADQPSLQAAAARLARAEALTRQVSAAQKGQVNASVDITRQRYSEHGLIPPSVAGTVQDTANAQLTGSIELDFFGRHQAALQAALGQQRAAQADHQAARVLLASQLARGHVALARLFSQRELAQRTLAQRQSLLRLTTERVQAGLDSRLEQTQAEAALPEARLQIEQLDEQIALARHQLAALSGQPPDALDRLQPAINQLRPLAPPDRLGADLLGRRADVVAARWRVEAAAQDVALARTQFYPDINLVGFVGLNALGLDQLFNLGSRTLGVGPALRLPVLDAGRLRAQLAGRAADADAAVAAYNGAVLQAVHEVADAGSSLQSLDRQLRQQADALQAAETAYDIAVQRYHAGLVGQVPVLLAETTVLAQRRQTVDLKARQIDAQLQLIRALGGGWQPQTDTQTLAGASR